ncbi:MAG: FAD-dependent oxidoreductase [Streptosporangiales bacterium]|nr:FAD-dependent oxidoreductase [Streptosporangiales bacterium]
MYLALTTGPKAHVVSTRPAARDAACSLSFVDRSWGLGVRVLVVGGGLAGTAVALALRQAGLEVMVCEATPVASEATGAFLTVASNGMLALAQLGVAAAGFALTSMRVRDDGDVEVAARALDDAGGPATRYQCLHRADLVDVMRSAVAGRGAELHHGRRLVAVAESADAVRATFADGAVADADLLVGAAGLVVDDARPRRPRRSAAAVRGAARLLRLRRRRRCRHTAPVRRLPGNG